MLLTTSETGNHEITGSTLIVGAIPVGRPKRHFTAKAQRTQRKRRTTKGGGDFVGAIPVGRPK